MILSEMRNLQVSAGPLKDKAQKFKNYSHGFSVMGIDRRFQVQQTVSTALEVLCMWVSLPSETFFLNGKGLFKIPFLVLQKAICIRVSEEESIWSWVSLDWHRRRLTLHFPGIEVHWMSTV